MKFNQPNLPISFNEIETILAIHSTTSLEDLLIGILYKIRDNDRLETD